MDFKQAIIENAWNGISIDYGLLHLQLATPFTVLIFILVMIFALNKLLFQPVLRTLDQRRGVVQGSLKQSDRLSKEFVRMQADFERELAEARKNVMEIHHCERNEGMKEREERILLERQELEGESERQFKQIQDDLKSVKQQFSKLTKRLSFLLPIWSISGFGIFAGV